MNCLNFQGFSIFQMEQKMFASINAVDDDNIDISDGNTLQISGKIFISDITIKPESQNTQNKLKLMEIVIKECTRNGTNKDTGFSKYMNHKLTLQLSASDIRMIFDKAFSSGILDLPGYSEVVAAQELLAKAAAKMQS